MELAENVDVEVELIHTWSDGNRYWQRGDGDERGFIPDGHKGARQRCGRWRRTSGSAHIDKVQLALASFVYTELSWT